MKHSVRWFTLAGLALAAPVVPGLTCGPSSPDPCDFDRLGCEEPDPNAEFYLASCPDDVDGPLEVEVGTGEYAFEGFAEGGGPFVHFGPQGGQHVFVGVRVANARLDVSPRLRLKFYLGQGAACAPPSEATSEIQTCAVKLGSRDVVLGAPGYVLQAGADGAVAEAGLVVFVINPDALLPGIIAVSVEDQCHRSGLSYQAWTRY